MEKLCDKLLRAAALAAGLLGLAGAAAAAEVQAKKDGVEVYSDATNKSEVVTTLKEGDALQAGERKGMFWSVTLKDGKAGFVSVLSVKHKPDANTDLAKAIKSVVKDGRGTDDATEGRQRSAVMGVRGLRADDAAGNAGNVRPNLRAVYAMEDRTVGKKDIEKLGQDVFDSIAKKSGIDE